MLEGLTENIQNFAFVCTLGSVGRSVSGRCSMQRGSFKQFGSVFTEIGIRIRTCSLIQIQVQAVAESGSGSKLLLNPDPDPSCCCIRIRIQTKIFV
jgi:hypothetical protein